MMIDMFNQDMYNRPQQMPPQNQQPYGYDMTSTLPSPMGGVNNSDIPSLYPSMMTPNLNKQVFMPSGGDNGGKPTYKRGGLAHIHGYKKGGFLKKAGKFLQKGAGIAAPFIGGALGGPGGAALGGALGGALQGKKNMLRNAAIGAGLGFAGAGGFGNLGGLGRIIPGVNAGVGGMMSGQGMAGFNGLSGIFGGAGGAGGMGGGMGTTMGGGGMDLNTGLLGLSALGMLLGKRKAPHEPSLSQHMSESGFNKGSGGEDRRVKPTERVQRILEEDNNEDGIPEKLYFEDVNPPVQYMAHGGYLDGDTGGQDDAIKARLADGEYVISADVVSALGDGNNRNGAKKFDHLMKTVRSHKYAKGGRGLPPKAKSLDSYMKMRKTRSA